MAPSGESNPGRWDSGYLLSVCGDALDVLYDAIQWQLTAARWESIEQILLAMDAALASGDMRAFAAAASDLELAGPMRISRIGHSVGPPPAVLTLQGKLVHTLGDVVAAQQSGKPQATGADDVDASSS